MQGNEKERKRRYDHLNIRTCECNKHVMRNKCSREVYNGIISQLQDMTFLKKEEPKH